MPATDDHHAEATGMQYVITDGRTRAVVTGVGAGLRALTVDGAPLTETFGADDHPPLGAGCVLVPWPNRTAGASWSWHGTEQRLEVTEAARGNAIHGLLRHATWAPVRHGDASVTLAAEVPPDTPGWPEPLHVETTYTVSGGGLAVTHVVTDIGSGDVPVGVGVHPYLRVGEAPVADCILTAATGTVVEVDEALIPTGTRPVTDAEDLRDGRRVGDLALDTCFGVDPGAGSLASLRGPGGAVELWADDTIRWLQIFTPDAFPRPDGSTGRAVAVEPMTCPPDALNSGTDLHVLAPGDSATVRWGLALVT